MGAADKSMPGDDRGISAAALKPQRNPALSNKVKFYTVKQIAEVLAVSPRTVQRWIDDGLLTAHRFGRSVRIAEADLRAFIALHRAV